jgi:hypothetical protein
MYSGAFRIQEILFFFLQDMKHESKKEAPKEIIFGCYCVKCGNGILEGSIFCSKCSKCGNQIG